MLLCELDGRAGVCWFASWPASLTAGCSGACSFGCWWMLFCELAGGMQFGVLVDAVLSFDLAGC